jgi:hypothetical protein
VQVAAFKRKYPNRPSGDWAKKTQKYRVPSSGDVVQVPLCDMVSGGGPHRRSCRHSPPQLHGSGPGATADLPWLRATLLSRPG